MPLLRVCAYVYQLHTYTQTMIYTPHIGRIMITRDLIGSYISTLELGNDMRKLSIQYELNWRKKINPSFNKATLLKIW